MSLWIFGHRPAFVWTGSGVLAEEFSSLSLNSDFGDGSVVKILCLTFKHTLLYDAGSSSIRLLIWAQRYQNQLASSGVRVPPLRGASSVCDTSTSQQVPFPRYIWISAPCDPHSKPPGFNHSNFFLWSPREGSYCLKLQPPWCLRASCLLFLVLWWLVNNSWHRQILEILQVQFQGTYNKVTMAQNESREVFGFPVHIKVMLHDTSVY